MAPLLVPSLPLLPRENLTPKTQRIHNKKLASAITQKPDIKSGESPKNLSVNWKWHRSMMILRILGAIIVHSLAMFGPFTFSWGALWVAVILYFVTGTLGITLSFHRHLSHKSFSLPKWLEYLFAYFGSLALQDDPIDWVKTHRYHHKFVDSKRDPHSPMEGFWHSHLNWFFYTNVIAQKRGITGITKDLDTQQFYKFMRTTYMLHQFALAYLLYALGGFSYVVWGMGVRIVCLNHAIACVNSVCHIWGNRVWNTNDLSKNNLWVALVSGGEGWHNNHHAFAYSARHGLEWWQVDMTWYVIKLLEAIGLAKDVKLPAQAHKECLAIKSECKKND